QKASPSSAYAMGGVAELLETNGDGGETARVGANGVMDHGVRVEPVEDAIADVRLDDESIEAAASHPGDELYATRMMDDRQAVQEFRAHLLEVYTERALTTAMDDDTSSIVVD